MWNNYEKMKREQKEAESAKVKSAKAVRPVLLIRSKIIPDLFNNKGYGTMDIYLEHDSLFLTDRKKYCMVKTGSV